jgi:hypothetical protein
MRLLYVIATLAIVSTATAAAPKPKFTATWKAPGVKDVDYAGKKVVGLIVTGDLPLRMSTEEALAQALTARGVQGLAAYRVIPKEEIADPESAKSWFQRTGASGVAIMRLVDLSKETQPSVVVWQSAPYYSSLWSYYPYAWGASINIGPPRTDVRVIVETLFFDIEGNRLLWAGTSESTNPAGAQELVKGIVEGAADQMRKDGLIRRK